MIGVGCQRVASNWGWSLAPIFYDNGTGIPESVIQEIFQPVFTTKPAGQGTGLGLSLSYNIVTKDHGRQMEVESRFGEGTVMTLAFL